jgi:hypothetical protein
VRKLTLVYVAFIALLIGCSSTIEDLENSEKAVRSSTNFNLNYQEVYSRIRRQSLQCNSGNASATATAEIDAELFSDLGYGEISYRINSMGANFFYWTARIEKTGSNASLLSIISANTIDNNASVKRLLAWANGVTGCSAGQ